MDNKGEGQFNRLSEFINKLATIEVKQSQDYKQIVAIQKKLEALQVINEKLITIDLKIGSLNHIATRLDQQGWEIEDNISSLEKRVDVNSADIANNMKEIKRLYRQIDMTYNDINMKLDSLHTTLKEDYLSNASFTQLQRNILWAIVSFIGVLIINAIIKYFGL